MVNLDKLIKTSGLKKNYNGGTTVAPPVAELIDRMESEYPAAKEELAGDLF